MKLKLEIPDKYIPELLTIMAIMLEAERHSAPAQDATPDHPELELAVTSTENAEDDPTMRELPWDYYWPDAPLLPDGKKRWVYRGTFTNKRIDTNGRYVFYLHSDGWLPTISFSKKYHHIEAI